MDRRSVSFGVHGAGSASLRRLVAAIFWLLVVLVGARPALAVSVLPLTLPDMVSHAAVAFEGVCTGSRVETDGATGQRVTFTTFDVVDVLKGTVGTTHTIKQIGAQRSFSATGTVTSHGVPSFVNGQRYVVMLYGVSELGFSSPVGLAQGSFVVRDRDSGRTVGNGRDFRAMLPEAARGGLPSPVSVALSSATTPVAELGLDDFKAEVRRLAGAPK